MNSISFLANFLEKNCKMIPAAPEQGFTLMELIVVMVLISLTAAFAVPKIQSSLYTSELRSTARRFIGLVAETGQEARSKRITIELRFDAENNMFTAVPAASVTDSPFAEHAERKEGYQKIRVDESVQVVDISSVHGDKMNTSSSDLIIRFNSRGYVDKTAVRLRGDNGDELSVMLSPFLGVTRVLEGHVSLDDNRFTVNR